MKSPPPPLAFPGMRTRAPSIDPKLLKGQIHLHRHEIIIPLVKALNDYLSGIYKRDILLLTPTPPSSTSTLLSIPSHGFVYSVTPPISPIHSITTRTRHDGDFRDILTCRVKKSRQRLSQMITRSRRREAMRLVELDASGKHAIHCQPMKR